MAHIIQLPKRKTLMAPTTSTAVPENAARLPDEPTLETTVMEAVAIKKWLHFALSDITFQLRMLAQDKTLSKRSFQEAKMSANIIGAYLMNVAADIDERLRPPTEKPQ